MLLFEEENRINDNVSLCTKDVTCGIDSVVLSNRDGLELLEIRGVFRDEFRLELFGSSITEGCTVRHSISIWCNKVQKQIVVYTTDQGVPKLVASDYECFGDVVELIELGKMHLVSELVSYSASKIQ